MGEEDSEETEETDESGELFVNPIPISLSIIPAAGASCPGSPECRWMTIHRVFDKERVFGLRPYRAMESMSVLQSYDCFCQPHPNILQSHLFHFFRFIDIPPVKQILAFHCLLQSLQINSAEHVPFRQN